MANSPITPNAVLQPNLVTKEITDIFVRQNFANLVQYFQTQNQLYGFVFFEQTFTKAQANYLLAHGLNYTPNDVIVTRITGGGTVSFNYGLFTSTNLNMTISGPCRIRFFAGSYRNFTSSVNNNAADTEMVGQYTALATLSAQLQTLITAIENLTMDIGGFGPQQGVVNSASKAALVTIATSLGNLIK